MSARGQRFTVRWKTPVYYSDFLDDFSKNPTTGALATVVNESSINQAIENLVNTVPGERRGRNAIGSKVLSTLFDPSSNPATLDALKASIISVVRNYEPRAEDLTVEVDASNVQNNSVTVNITYRPVNLPQTVTYSFDLRRVR